MVREIKLGPDGKLGWHEADLKEDMSGGGCSIGGEGGLGSMVPENAMNVTHSYTQGETSQDIWDKASSMIQEARTILKR